MFHALIVGSPYVVLFTFKIGPWVKSSYDITKWLRRMRDYSQKRTDKNIIFSSRHKYLVSKICNRHNAVSMLLYF